jgi:hypothetical protein
MLQHLLLSAVARALSLGQITRKTDDEARGIFTLHSVGRLQRRAVLPLLRPPELRAGRNPAAVEVRRLSPRNLAHVREPRKLPVAITSLWLRFS